MTPKQAVNRGILIIGLPLFAIIIGVMVGLYYLAENGVIHALLFLPGGFVMAPLAAWAYWRFAFPKWLIWAMSKVDDHSELKFYAVNSGFVLSESSFHVSNSKDAKLIKKLENEYLSRQQKKVFKDDLSMPEIEEVGYSSASLITKVVIVCVFFAFGLYLFTSLANWVFGLILISIGGISAHKYFKKIASKEIPLKIGNFGIEVHGNRYEWRQIQSEKAVVEGTGEYRSNYLIFKGNSKPLKINIDDFDISLNDLRRKLIFYRARYNNSDNNHRKKQSPLNLN